MTQDEIIEIAKQAGMMADGEWWFTSFDNVEQDVHISHLERFAKLVAQHEREACAKVADNFAITSQYKTQRSLAEWCASSIRARGET